MKVNLQWQYKNALQVTERMYDDIWEHN